MTRTWSSDVGQAFAQAVGGEGSRPLSARARPQRERKPHTRAAPLKDRITSRIQFMLGSIGHVSPTM
jgi:hypothetical protein